MLFFSGDLEYACNELGLRHFNGASCCCFCNANRSDIPFNDFHADAQWRRTVLIAGQFARHIRKPKHPVVAHPWFSIYTYRLDLLHIFDHHGITSVILANVLAYHIRRASPLLPGSTLEERLTSLNDEIRAWYSIAGIENRLPRLKQTNIWVDGEFPEMQGNAVKAANTRSLAPFVLDLQQRAVDIAPTDVNKHMLKVVESLHAAYEVMYGAGLFVR